MKNIKINRNSQLNNDRQSVKQASFDRVNLIRLFLFAVGLVIIAKLFYIQVIKHDYYQGKALAEHVKKYEIQPKRGLIYAMDGDNKLPIVLNEERFEIYADPKLIKNDQEAAKELSKILKIDEAEIAQKIENKDSRYAIIAKKATKTEAESVKGLDIIGIGQRKIFIRTYPQGQLAAQVLGFVNDNQEGQYGVEGSQNAKLAGKTGQVKAITDVNGVPLAVSNDNIQIEPKPGEDLQLSIDISMQKMAEDAIAEGVSRTQSKYGSAIILDPNTGEIKAMANLPTYDPSNYSIVKDQNIFNNKSVTGAWEPGSVIKPLTLAAAFNEGKLNKNSSYYDSGSVQIDDRVVTNSMNWGARSMNMTDLLSKSLNTGAVYVLKSLGGGSLNSESRNTWYNYLTDNFQFAKLTNIEQSGENPGVVSDPNKGYGLNVRYGNMSFGQGFTVTPIQLAAAYAALVNGGTYYSPSLITGEKGFEPKVSRSNVVSPQTSQDVKELLKLSLEANNRPAVRSGYVLGAKSGTAQIADGNGNYREDAYNGTYVGFIEGEKLEYVVLVRLDEPKTPGFASAEAAKTWAVISNKLIDNYNISPKK